jgi:hypothetical protein
MRTNWFGRVFGRGRVYDAWASAGGSLANGTVPAKTSLVDSDELSAELARARRYEHDLAVVVLSAQPSLYASATSPSSAESRVPQMVALMTAVALREALRHSDIVCYQASENRFVLALAESGADDAGPALQRIATDFGTRLRLQVRAGVATFPHDALTLDELVQAAAGRAARPVGAPARMNNGDIGHNGSIGHNGNNGYRAGRRTDGVRAPSQARREHV